MKKLTAVLLILLAVNIFAQQNEQAPKKFALVIGNGNYTSFGSLQNAVNDANDMADALQDLGFTVDKVLNGNRAQMVEGITKLKNRLSLSENSYGFLFYAGHGVQFNGVNYLIPAKADIPSANYLGDTAISVQTMLAELNDAGNELNVVVLDACRDFPAAWSRSMNRGLSVESNQPADSIIVYATSAGSTASDGTGRNGLFTSQLLKNIKTPGLEVNDVFRRTGADVAQASGRQQLPAIYSQFYGIAYLGQPPAQPVAETAAEVPVQPVLQPEAPLKPLPTPPKERAPQSNYEGEKWAVGALLGYRFSPIGYDDVYYSRNNNGGLYVSFHGAYAFGSIFSLQAGLSYSSNNGYSSVEYNTYYPYNTSDVNLKFSVLDIPLLAVFNFHPSGAWLVRLSMGPLFSFSITDADYTESPAESGHELSLENSFSFGVNAGIGVGYRVGKGYFIFDIRSFINFKWNLKNASGTDTDYYVRYGLPMLLFGYEFCF